MEKGRKWKKGRSGLREKNVIIDWEIIWICFLGKLWCGISYYKSK